MVNQLMKEYEYDDTISYRIGCDCRSPDHDISLYAEQDPDGFAHIQFSANLHTPYWYKFFETPVLKWLNEPIKRIKIAVEVLFQGYTEYNFEFILGKDNISALRYALDEIEKKMP